MKLEILDESSKKVIIFRVTSMQATQITASNTRLKIKINLFLRINSLLLDNY